MNQSLITLANTLWALTALPKALRFRQAFHDPAAAQRRVLRRILRNNADSAAGRRHGFADIESVSEYQNRVPRSTYEDIADDVDRIAAGEDGVLTTAPVQLLEPTSGSTAATKYIPYTHALQDEFQRAIAPWIVDTFQHHPRLMTGSAYWSVSPIGDRPEETDGGIPIGFEDDSDYLDPIQAALARRVMAVPPCVQHIRDMETFRYVTLLGLLYRADLALVSVWNPTFFTLLLSRLLDWGDRLADDLAAGTLSPPRPLPSSVQTQLEQQWDPRPDRADSVRTALELDAAQRHMHLWPNLQVVSCWADGPAASHADDLSALLPHAHLQSKGLLATEGIVTIPMTDAPGGVPALRSHFFEFQPADGGNPVLLDALTEGTQYDVILTTGGGLYRYRLQDRVEGVGTWHGVPCVRFVGKSNHVVDHFGEKLHARHVQRAVDKAFTACDQGEPPFAMVAPDGNTPMAYTLFVQTTVSDAILSEIGRRVENALRDNYHYDYARRLDQLAPLRIFRISEAAQATYLARCVDDGQRAGDVKPTVLHDAPNWSRHFKGEFLSSPVEATAHSE